MELSRRLGWKIHSIVYSPRESNSEHVPDSFLKLLFVNPFHALGDVQVAYQRYVRTFQQFRNPHIEN